MRAAGKIIADEARRLASAWSKQIPPEIRVEARTGAVSIRSHTGPSYPNEMPRVRHPVFGFGTTGNEWSATHRPSPPWVTNAHRPFLAPAAAAKADDAAAEIAKTIDDVCHEMGFEGTG